MRAICKYLIEGSMIWALFWGGSSLLADQKSCESSLKSQLTQGGYVSRTDCGVTGDLMTWVAILEKDPRLSIDDVSSFVINHSNWPQQDKLCARVESLMDPTLDPKTVTDWFAAHPPETSDGYMYYALALKALGQKQKSLDIAREGWVQRNFTREEAQIYLKAFGKGIRPQDHEARLERLLWDEEIDQAKRLVSLVGPTAHEMAEARLALMISESPKAAQGDHSHEGVLFEKVRAYRKTDQLDTAIALLKKAPARSEYAAQWWRERNYLARELLLQGKYQDAYALIENHGLEEGEAYAEADFLAGFVALRFLNKADTALGRFTQLHDRVTSPISKSRAAYWAGRAAEAQKDIPLAASWYEKGAVHTTSFYGQLSAEKLQKRSHPTLAAAPKASSQERKAFESQALVKAFKILTKMGKAADQYMLAFAFHIGKRAETTAERHLLVEMAAKLGSYTAASVAKKVGFYEGVHLKAAYPKINHPHGQKGVETALIHGIIMQESRFDAGAVSSAGAMGLMQLMPATAKKEAKKMKMAHSVQKLHDPKHNIKLGAQHIQGLLQNFDGSYILAIASYNAGKNAVNRWLQDLGDPRRGEIDVIDWLEMVPYYETRNYVQRVLENVNVYRAHEDSTPKLTLVHDLQR